MPVGYLALCLAQASRLVIRTGDCEDLDGAGAFSAFDGD